MKIPFLKTKAEREIEQDLRLRQGVQRIRRYIKNTEDIRNKYWEAARKALELDDEESFRRFGKRYVLCGEDIHTWERFLLELQVMDVERDRVRATNSFIESLHSMTGSLRISYDNEDLAQMQLKLEESLVRGRGMAAKLGELTEVMDVTADGFVDPNVVEGRLQQVREELEGRPELPVSSQKSPGVGDHQDEQAELERRVAEGIRDLERSLRGEARKQR